MTYDDQKPPPDPSRREMLIMLGAVMLAGHAQAQSNPNKPATEKPPACIATPEQTEGPYFVDERLHRSDIRTDPADGSVKAGVPLTLGLRIHAMNGSRCTPVPGAIVDVWHCDAEGVYSDVTDPRFDTTGKQFLRGYQITDMNGAVRFLTIYPGWYPGRTVHIHFKVRTTVASGRHYAFTSQLYFDDAMTDRVHAQKPYAGHGMRRQRNEDDGLFRRGGRQLMLSLTEDGQGYSTAFDVGLQLT